MPDGAAVNVRDANDAGGCGLPVAGTSFALEVAVADSAGVP